MERLSGNKIMYCIPIDIPQSLCEIDDELKAIYHSKDAVCIWVFGNREDRNNFEDETATNYAVHPFNKSIIQDWKITGGGRR